MEMRGHQAVYESTVPRDKVGSSSQENGDLSTNISLKAGNELLQNKYQTCNIISKFILRFVGFSNLKQSSFHYSLIVRV